MIQLRNNYKVNDEDKKFLIGLNVSEDFPNKKPIIHKQGKFININLLNLFHGISDHTNYV